MYRVVSRRIYDRFGYLWSRVVVALLYFQEGRVFMVSYGVYLGDYEVFVGRVFGLIF